MLLEVDYGMVGEGMLLEVWLGMLLELGEVGDG